MSLQKLLAAHGDQGVGAEYNYAINDTKRPYRYLLDWAFFNEKFEAVSLDELGKREEDLYGIGKLSKSGNIEESAPFICYKVKEWNVEWKDTPILWAASKAAWYHLIGKPRDEFAPLHVALHENVSLTGSIVALLQASTSSYEEISAAIGEAKIKANKEFILRILNEKPYKNTPFYGSLSIDSLSAVVEAAMPAAAAAPSVNLTDSILHSFGLKSLSDIPRGEKRKKSVSEGSSSVVAAEKTSEEGAAAEAEGSAEKKKKPELTEEQKAKRREQNKIYREKKREEKKRLAEQAAAANGETEPKKESGEEPKAKKSKKEKKEKKEKDTETPALPLSAEEQARLEKRRAQDKARREKKREEKLKAKQAEEEARKKREEEERNRKYPCEDLDLPDSEKKPPVAEEVETELRDSYGQLLMISLLLNTFGRQLGVKPMLLHDLEAAVLDEEKSAVLHDVHIRLLQLLFKEYYDATSDEEAEAERDDEAAAETSDEDLEGQNGKKSSGGLLFRRLINAMVLTRENWAEMCRRYIVTLRDEAPADLAEQLRRHEYKDLPAATKVSLLECLCNQITQTALVRKFVDQTEADIADMKKEEWEATKEKRAEKKKELEEKKAKLEKEAAAATNAGEAKPAEAEVPLELMDRKESQAIRAQARKEKEAQRRREETLKQRERKSEARQRNITSMRARLRGATLLGYDRHMNRYWLFETKEMAGRLLIEYVSPNRWFSYNTVEKFAEFKQFLNKKGLRESGLLKELQKYEDQIVERIEGGASKFTQKRKEENRKLVRPEEPRDPLAEARKKLLELKDTLPASALTTPKDGGWSSWKAKVESAKNFRAVGEALLALEENIPLSANLLLQSWKQLGPHWREEFLTSLTGSQAAFGAAQWYFFFDFLQEKTKKDFNLIAKTACQVCGSKGDERKMLLCDQCDDGYHIFCLSPPLKAIPSGDWFCIKCTGEPEKLAPRSASVRASARLKSLSN